MNVKLQICAIGMGALLLSALAASATSDVKPEASIPFANHGGINDWRADGDRGLWVQGINRKWFYAKFLGTCPQLQFANTVGFVSEPSGALNRWSSIRVRHGGRCQFIDFQPSEGPPVKAKKKDQPPTAPAAAAAVAANG
jgi:Family of unknown function (DUF6491)